MGHLCDFCGEQRPIVYCRSDAATLCLSCDRNVHSANALSRRHSRTLLCQRCTTHPASLRCFNENVSLCQNCHWNALSRSSLPTQHRTQTIHSYSGCPSAEELSRIWSFVLDVPSPQEYACHHKMALMSIHENTVGDYSVRSNVDHFAHCTESSSMPATHPMQTDVDQMLGSFDSNTNKHIIYYL